MIKIKPKQATLFLFQTALQVKEFAKARSEHDLRLKVKDAFFADYSVDVEDERIDFLVYQKDDPFLWAESKGKPTGIYEMFAQLLLTIKRKKIDKGEHLPAYLGVFDKEKIAFTEYHNALGIFNLNDFNWKERPSSVSQETIGKVARHLKNVVECTFESDVAEIVEFIRANYERPPKQEYHKHIIERRDLLVPKDLRERRGAFFTPPVWVRKSQEYLAKVFGKNWQEEYYVWDCCAGTCNLLAGLNNPHHVWASTLDQPDVDIVHENIANNELNLLAKHVFQFDFLNDDFSKLPKSLRDIITDEEKRKKLIIYMNPPYAEAMNRQDTKKAKIDVNRSLVEQKYQEKIGKSVREVFVQFFIRIAQEIPDCLLATFGKLKYVCSPNFLKFRQHFKAKFRGGFVCRANTFDNVNGQFPIGFLIWDLSNKKTITKIQTDVFGNDRHITECWKENVKVFHALDHEKFVNDWLKQFVDVSSEKNPMSMCCIGNDFQHNNYVNIDFSDNIKGVGNAKGIAKFTITPGNFIEACIYFSVRHCIEATWLNDRDQFLFPNDGYLADKGFQNDCIIFALFHQQNRIGSRDGVNHIIPFTAREVNAKDNFQSTLMSDFLQTRKKMSKEAKAVLNAGKALWTYYHDTIKLDSKALIDASLYEIREYFKGRNAKGRMKAKATDERFNELDAELRASLKKLAEKIQPKVYEYGFLRE